MKPLIWVVGALLITSGVFTGGYYLGGKVNHGSLITGTTPYLCSDSKSMVVTYLGDLLEIFVETRTGTTTDKIFRLNGTHFPYQSADQSIILEEADNGSKYLVENGVQTFHECILPPVSDNNW